VASNVVDMWSKCGVESTLTGSFTPKQFQWSAWALQGLVNRPLARVNWL